MDVARTRRGWSPCLLAHVNRCGSVGAGSSGHRRGPPGPAGRTHPHRSEEHTSELQSRLHLVCRLLLEKKKKEHVEERAKHNTSTPQSCSECYSLYQRPRI